MKAICIEQNGQKVLINIVADDSLEPVGAELIALSSADYPETSPEVRAFIDQNPNRSLNLHKVVEGAIVLRSIEELEASEFLTWTWAFNPPPPPEPEEE